MILPKFKRLARELGLPIYATAGILECLWHFTAQCAERGNIGKYTDDDIAEAVGWDRPPGDLVSALVKFGWLDKCRHHRLIVHDWHQHADDATKKRVERSGETWASVGQRRTTADNGGQNLPTADNGSLPEPEPEPEPEPVPEPEPEPQPLAAVADDPWGKPVRVPISDIRDEADRRLARTTPTNPHLAEVSGMLRAFGFNVSNAAKYGASLNATPDRVRWLCATAKGLVESGKFTPDGAIGFVVNGIRTAKDPDPGPVVEEYGAKIMRMIQEEKDLIAKSKRGET
jgi:hypothetical protein